MNEKVQFTLRFLIQIMTILPGLSCYIFKASFIIKIGCLNSGNSNELAIFWEFGNLFDAWRLMCLFLCLSLVARILLFLNFSTTFYQNFDENSLFCNEMETLLETLGQFLGLVAFIIDKEHKVAHKSLEKEISVKTQLIFGMKEHLSRKSSLT